MAMRASVNIYLLVEFVAHGELMRLVVVEVAQLAVYRAGSEQWGVTRVLPDLVPEKEKFRYLTNPLRFS